MDTLNGPQSNHPDPASSQYVPAFNHHINETEFTYAITRANHHKVELAVLHGDATHPPRFSIAVYSPHDEQLQQITLSQQETTCLQTLLNQPEVQEILRETH
ncbi:hypothetical protein [Dictyobacter kobayashii]|uniref:Uncharacterized protein n=1 Tax=Dictyobacter kobayashii TaxID=2014872 RepID=A0A402AEP1_9CHLR|nr:hypothetical protein [Dictyobacter kobayashii]GCE17569.1 hypothetical protein KDK_13690 [Dictyobacter kobayashii]